MARSLCYVCNILDCNWRAIKETPFKTKCHASTVTSDLLRSHLIKWKAVEGLKMKKMSSMLTQWPNRQRKNNNDLHCPTLRRLNTRYLCNQTSGKSFFPHLSAVYDHVQKVALRFFNYHQHKPKTIKQCCKERLFPLTVPLSNQE